MSRPIKSETKKIGLTIFVLLAVCFSSCQICVVPHFCFLSPVFAKSKSVTHYVLLLPIFCFPIAFAAFYQITLSSSANCLRPCEIFSPLLLLLHRSSNLTPLTIVRKSDFTRGNRFFGSIFPSSLEYFSEFFFFQIYLEYFSEYWVFFQIFQQKLSEDLFFFFRSQ